MHTRPKFTVPLIAVCAVSLLGCDKRADPYDAAMKRLVAEQKQLDWIDAKIQEIEVSANSQAEELQKSAEDLASSSAALSPEMGEKGLRVMEASSGVQEQILSNASKRNQPWLQKRAAQLERIENARRAVDQLRQSH